jgi:hypothetical protein
MKRIKWTRDERDAVVHELVNVYVDNPFLNGYDAIMRAQRVLPKDRQRATMSKTMPSLYADDIAEAKSEANKVRKAVREFQEAAPAPVLEPTLGDVFEKLVDMIVKRVVAEVRRELPATSPTAPIFAEASARMEERQRRQAENKARPTIDVLIIGLNGWQLSAIEDLEDKLNMDFRMLNAEEAKTRPYLNRTYTILMTKFICHAVQDKYRSASNLTYCNGGVTELRNLLNSIAEKHK